MSPKKRTARGQKCPQNVTKVSTRCHLFCPRDVTYYVHEMSATQEGWYFSIFDTFLIISSCIEFYKNHPWCFVTRVNWKFKNNIRSIKRLKLDFVCTLLNQKKVPTFFPYTRWSWTMKSHQLLLCKNRQIWSNFWLFSEKFIKSWNAEDFLST